MTTLRGYQQRAVELGKGQSLIVVLPTGSGKTLIAATIAAHHARKGSAVLFLVPTCLLVQQQARAMRDETGLVVVEYMGGAEAPPISRRFHVLVSTPAAFISINALSSSSDGRFRYDAFACVVFDEVHHVMKKHPYRSIARSLACMRSPPLILGLTASLTYAIQTSRIQTAILELCSELNISGDCIFSASQEELIVDGYHASATSSVMLTSDLDLSGSTAGMDGLEIPGKPHAVMSDFMRCYEARSLHALSLEVVDSVHIVEALVFRLDTHFVTPIGAAGKRGKSGEWSFYANERKATCVGRGLQQLYNVLEHLYEAMRLLINSRQTALELAMTYLEMNDVLHLPVLASLNECWRSCRDKFCRIIHLKEVLSQQSERFPDGLRCIVFVQQRITTHILHHALSSDEDLKSVLVSDYIYATSTPATCTLSVSPARSRETIELFRSGQVQVLFATSVAEEGMDIPAANCVIRFDAVTTPVSLVQSRGRARQADSSFVILSETECRSVQSLERAEHAQHEAISTLKSNDDDSREMILIKRKRAQESRRNTARPLLAAFRQGTNKQPPLATLNAYAQKVSGEVVESTVKHQQGFTTNLRLMQFDADAVVVTGEGPTKKAALQQAAKLLMDETCRVFLKSK